ncbi:MAG TPA: substrate-binding protein [Gammaproteobacteria bacterium]|nr:substrate-binding protein [Gammaproteobacteria bacterium]
MSEKNGPRNPSRRDFLIKSSALLGAAAGTMVLGPRWAWAAEPIRVGIATDLTGPIGVEGKVDARIAKMFAEKVNSNGGILGRPVHLYIVDTASSPSVGVRKASELIRRDNVDIVFGGITSAMRNAIKGPIVERGQTLYVYPQLYEGGECTKYLYCTGPVPPQQIDPLVPWLIKNAGKKFWFPSANYVWPHVLNKYTRKSIEAHGGEVLGEEYFPLNQTDYGTVVQKIMNSDTDVVFCTVIPPGIAPFLKQLHNAGFAKRGGRVACVYFDDNAASLVPDKILAGMITSLDYLAALQDPYDKAMRAEYAKMFPNAKVHIGAGNAATGMYRGLLLWEKAVREAKSIKRDAVAEALDHAKIAQGPGGPAQMVPGERHCRMHMYIGVANEHGKFQVAERSHGLLDPKQC